MSRTASLDPARPRAAIAVAAAAVGALVVALAPTVAVPAQAAVAVPPTPALSGVLDSFPTYQEQSSCTPTPKPGAAKLRDLIRRTYGDYSIGIYRDCSIGGVSEHKEGRALDWMVSVRNAGQKAKAEAFLSWLTKPDSEGNPAANARRLGIMYIGWNDRFWRGYDVDRGWTELHGCFAPDRKAKGYDTICHRNHVHLSLTWEGAMAMTSYWTGKALAPTCDPGWGSDAGAPVAGAGLVPVAPVRVLDTAAGTGLDEPCRLGQPQWSSDTRMLAVQVTGRGDVPAEGVAAVAVRATTWRASAPFPTLRLRARTTSASVPAVSTWTTASYGSTVVVPVASDGTIRLSLDKGTADVRLDVVGYAPASVPAEPLGALPSGTARAVRPTAAAVGSAVKPGETRILDLSGTAGMPADGLAGVSVSVQSAATSTQGLVQVSAPGAAVPASTLRTATRASRVAQALVPTVDGRISLRNTGTSPVVLTVRVHGWWTAAAVEGAAATTTLASPVAVLNTVTGLGFKGAFTSAAARRLLVTGKAGVPAGAKAVLLQVSVLGGTKATTLWAAGSGAVPAVSANKGRWAHDLVIVPLGPDGAVSFSTTTYGAHARAVVVGYTA
jgi:hypothetical protein